MASSCRAEPSPAPRHPLETGLTGVGRGSRCDADLTVRPRVCHDAHVTALADSRTEPTAGSTPDHILAQATDAARGFLIELAAASDIGEHLGVQGEGDLLVTHLFACMRPGYQGWRWSVTIVRATDQEQPTVNEVVLIPGAEAIVAPAWVPYRERIQPGDLSPGDLLPVEDEDPRLVATYSFGDDPLDSDAKAQVRQVSKDLGLGRVRTLSPEGVDMAAERWYDGDGGPETALAKNAPESCWSCGFLMRLSGHLAGSFGVCANGNANDDARVVSLNHGCGAHSEVKLARKQQPIPVPDHVWDTLTDDEFESL